jgi:DinB family protein
MNTHLTVSVAIPRPADDEAAPFYHGYIAEVKGENIREQLAAQLGEVERLLRPLDDTRAQVRYAPGKWSIKEVLGHLTDAERIFAYRLLRIARNDPTPLPGFDENAYVPAGQFDERPLQDLIADFRAVRQSTGFLVASVLPGAWSRRGEASGSAVSARALAYIIVGHVAHHLGVLRDRYRLG